ncbi:MAG: cytochrome c [Gammaproteobacteria bacterium]|nr:cytochrome c [Gammaproteobacteria bacterium]
MLKSIMLTLLFFPLWSLSGCSQQDSAQFDLEQAKQKWGSSGVAWTETDLQLLESGELLYRSNCSVCHGRDGKGDMQLGGPELDGSPFANGQKSELIERILQGKKGSAMPAFADALSDKQIAAIASYLRNAWKNQAADIVTAEEVKQLR